MNRSIKAVMVIAVMMGVNSVLWAEVVPQGSNSAKPSASAHHTTVSADRHASHRSQTHRLSSSAKTTATKSKKSVKDEKDELKKQLNNK